MIELDGLSHSGFESEDLDRCAEFYTRVLGAKIEIEAHYPTAAEALAVVESGQDQRKRDLNLYKGTASVEEIKAQAGLAPKPS